MMVKMSYRLNGNIIDRGLIRKRDYMLLVQIEGSLAISSSSHVFFEEPYMNLLELAIGLQAWIHSDRAKEDFWFTSVDHDEPILSFTRVQGDTWKVDSIWKKHEPFEVSEAELIGGIGGFVGTLDKDLRQEYGVRIADFPSDWVRIAR